MIDRSAQRGLIDRAVKEVLDAQKGIEHPGDREEVHMVLRLAMAMAMVEEIDRDELKRSLDRFAKAIREGLFD